MATVVLHGQGEIGSAVKSFVYKGRPHHLGARGQAVLKSGIGGVTVFVCHVRSSSSFKSEIEPRIIA
jgi:hypothetical protein